MLNPPGKAQGLQITISRTSTPATTASSMAPPSIVLNRVSTDVSPTDITLKPSMKERSLSPAFPVAKTEFRSANKAIPAAFGNPTGVITSAKRGPSSRSSSKTKVPIAEYSTADKAVYDYGTAAIHNSYTEPSQLSSHSSSHASYQGTNSNVLLPPLPLWNPSAQHSVSASERHRSPAHIEHSASAPQYLRGAPGLESRREDTHSPYKVRDYSAERRAAAHSAAHSAAAQCQQEALQEAYAAGAAAGAAVGQYYGQHGQQMLVDPVTGVLVPAIPLYHDPVAAYAHLPYSTYEYSDAAAAANAAASAASAYQSYSSSVTPAAAASAAVVAAAAVASQQYDPRHSLHSQHTVVASKQRKESSIAPHFLEESQSDVGPYARESEIYWREQHMFSQQKSSPSAYLKYSSYKTALPGALTPNGAATPTKHGSATPTSSTPHHHHHPHHGHRDGASTPHRRGSTAPHSPLTFGHHSPTYLHSLSPCDDTSPTHLTSPTQHDRTLTHAYQQHGSYYGANAARTNVPTKHDATTGGHISGVHSPKNRNSSTTAAASKIFRQVNLDSIPVSSKTVNCLEDLPDADPSGAETTLMLRNVPNRFTQSMFLGLLDDKGFSRTEFNYCYLPMDFKTKSNIGYAFVNCKTPEIVERFKKTFTGLKLKSENSKKVCIIAPARMQGVRGNVRTFLESPLHAINVGRQFRPIVFDEEGKERRFSHDLYMSGVNSAGSQNGGIQSSPSKTSSSESVKQVCSAIACQ